jgi:hypothetical protein
MFKDYDIDYSLIMKPVGYNHDKAPFRGFYAPQRKQRVL